MIKLLEIEFMKTIKGRYVYHPLRPATTYGILQLQLRQRRNQTRKVMGVWVRSIFKFAGINVCPGGRHGSRFSVAAYNYSVWRQAFLYTLR